MLSGECTLIVEEEERPLRQWDYFHCPAETRHVIVGGGDGPCAILMIGARPDVKIRYPVSEVAAKYGASAAKETGDPDEAYADWPGEYVPVRLPWPLDSDAKPMSNPGSERTHCRRRTNMKQRWAHSQPSSPSDHCTSAAPEQAHRPRCRERRRSCRCRGKRRRLASPS